jgi:putative ABC transport system permease protein
VKAARTKNIPIFVSDVERLPDGALGAFGYDYSISGVQAAHLVDRILKGENPKDIPFERYTKMTFGFNLRVAKEIGTTIPAGLLAEATRVYGLSQPEGGKKSRIGIIQFATEPNVELCKKGLLDGLAYNGYVDGNNIEITSRTS